MIRNLICKVAMSGTALNGDVTGQWGKDDLLPCSLLQIAPSYWNLPVHMQLIMLFNLDAASLDSDCPCTAACD